MPEKHHDFPSDINITLILSMIGERPICGYQLAKKIEEKSSGYFKFAQASIYPLLHRLEKEKAITGNWEDYGGKQRRVYSLTIQGEKTLESSRLEWQRFLDAFKPVFNTPAPSPTPHCNTTFDPKEQAL